MAPFDLLQTTTLPPPPALRLLHPSFFLVATTMRPPAVHLHQSKSELQAESQSTDVVTARLCLYS